VIAARRLRSLLPALKPNKAQRRVKSKSLQTNKFVDFNLAPSKILDEASVPIGSSIEDPPAVITAVGPVGSIFRGIPLKISAKSLGYSPKRARYFHDYRHERTCLKILENTHSINLTYAEYRANRYIYYIVFPRLARCLWWLPDRERLNELGKDLYSQILSYRYFRGNTKGQLPSEINFWSFVRHYDC